MKIGITVPNNWGVEDVRDVVALGQQAEQLGFDSIWTMDHLLNIGFVRDRLDNKPYFHPLGILSFLAARTTTITLGTSVMVLPYHNPFELAKYAATLDQLSRGRFILGVGAGGTREESDALGLDFHRRGAIANEMMQVMRELWSSDMPAFSGANWRFESLRFSPKPVQRPLPMWVGGASPGAMKRAATLGDGWHPNGVSPENYRAAAEQIREMAAAAGRDPGQIYLSVRANIRLNPRAGATPSPFDGSSQDMVNAIGDYARVGVEHVLLAPDSGNVALVLDKMKQIAGEVIPNFR
ncbi:MAG: LLM class F420-dependent oxidoreductase [Chloroflexi bacterium]|nr:LLM class F420-dependent oxidoreductase [Chloroflexota bacterium]